MSRSVFNKLFRCHKIQLEPPPLICLSANSQKINIQGVFKYKMRICNFTWKVQFLLVDNLLFPIILGVDFLSNSSLVLDTFVRR